MTLFWAPAARVKHHVVGRPSFSVGEAGKTQRKAVPQVRDCYRRRTTFGYRLGEGRSDMKDEANFKKRMLELVEDGYIVFDKMGRWRVTEKGLACLIACADRAGG